MESVYLLVISYFLLVILGIAYFIYWAFVPNNISIIKNQIKYQNEILNEINDKLNNNKEE